MWKLKIKTYDEETKELVQTYYEYEGQPITMSMVRRKGNLIKTFNQECSIGRKLVRETIFHKEQLEYWRTHFEEYKKLHSWATTLDESLRKDLVYYIMEVVITNGDEIVKKETFRYGL